MSTLPTGQTFNRVGAIALGTERGNITAMNRAKNPNIVPYLNSLQNEINNLNSLLNSGKLNPQTRKKISNELKRLLKMVNNIKVPLYNNPNLEIVFEQGDCTKPSFPATKWASPPFSDGKNKKGNMYDFLYMVSNQRSSLFYGVGNFQGKYKGKMSMDSPTIPLIVKFECLARDGSQGIFSPATCVAVPPQNRPPYYIGTYTDAKGGRVAAHGSGPRIPPNDCRGPSRPDPRHTHPVRRVNGNRLHETSALDPSLARGPAGRDQRFRQWKR